MRSITRFVPVGRRDQFLPRNRLREERTGERRNPEHDVTLTGEVDPDRSSGQQRLLSAGCGEQFEARPRRLDVPRAALGREQTEIVDRIPRSTRTSPTKSPSSVGRSGVLPRLRNTTSTITPPIRHHPGGIATQPERTIADALDHLNKMRPSARGQAKKWLDEWERLLDVPVDRILAALTDRSLRGRELRQNSPFAGALTEEQRRSAHEAWRSHDVGNPRGR